MQVKWLGCITRGSVVGALWLLCACGSNSTKGPKYQLEGSVTQLFDLGYDQARILVAEEDVALLFVRTRPLDTIRADGGTSNNDMQGMSEDYPLKVSYALWGEPIPVKKRVDLAQVSDDPAMTGRTVASRDVLNDPRKSYPAIRIGSLIFNADPMTSSRVTGDFNITFTNGIETASGRTVFGTFEAKVGQ